jgi:hypothetical protein
MSKKLVKIESFTALAKMIEDGEIEAVYNKDNRFAYAKEIDHHLFTDNGYCYMDVEEPKTYRERCVKLIIENEFLLDEKTACVWQTDRVVMVNEDGVSIAGDVVPLIDFLKNFKPITREERNKRFMEAW